MSNFNEMTNAIFNFRDCVSDVLYDDFGLNEGEDFIFKSLSTSADKKITDNMENSYNVTCQIYDFEDEYEVHERISRGYFQTVLYKAYNKFIETYTNHIEIYFNGGIPLVTISGNTFQVELRFILKHKSRR